jgi:hypothetical protein
MASIQHITGTVTTTNASLDVKGDKVGFKPSKVIIHNPASGGIFTWHKDMPDGYAVKQKNGSATAMVTSACVTPLADGFNLGTASDLNSTAGQTLYYEAIG